MNGHDHHLSSVPVSSKIVPGCRYVTPHVPTTVRQLARKIMQHNRLVIDNGTNTDTLTLTRQGKSVSDDVYYGTFHIRRGDLIDHCNTSIKRMRSYLKCSVVQPVPHERERRQNFLPNVTILFSTDEKDSKYRTSIQSLIQVSGIQ